MIIEVEKLKKDYTTYERNSSFKDTLKSLFHREPVTVEALKEISFTINKGELAALLGPNGAGKSTTLKILSGVLHPTSGNVSVMGYIPWKERKKYVCRIGAVFGQRSQLIWDIPPVDSFFLNKAIYDIPDKLFKVNLDMLTTILNIQNVMKKPTRQLSLGERMKCEFVMSMLHQPEIVFLDEPTIGLDLIAKDTIRKFILEMNSNGTTFILTTHDLTDVERMARRVIVINKGDIVCDDQLAGLKKRISNKKNVRITFKEPYVFDEAAGMKLVTRYSEYEAELQIDTTLIDISNFINKVNEDGKIHDLSIQDVAIEETIKEFYTCDEKIMR